MGVVGLPSRVTGLAAISIMAEITFMPDFQVSSNSSQCACASGLAWRLILRTTVLAMVILPECYLIFKNRHDCVHQRNDRHGPEKPGMTREGGIKQYAADDKKHERRDFIKTW